MVSWRPPFHDALIAAWRLSKQEADVCNGDVLEVCKDALGLDASLLESKTASGRRLKVSSRAFTKATRRMSAAIVATEQGVRASVEKAFASGRFGKPVFYFDFGAADETPMRMSLVPDVDGTGALAVPARKPSSALVADERPLAGRSRGALGGSAMGQGRG